MVCSRPLVWYYEAWAILSETELVSLQPLGADQATLPHMKAMHVPFHLVYGSLISFKGRVAIFDNLPDQWFTGKTIGKNYLPVTLGKI